MTASNSSTGQFENIRSEFSSEFDSDISIETEAETETESETYSCDSEASCTSNLQSIDRNNNEWNHALDRDNDEPSFTGNVSPLWTPCPINCISST